MAFDGFVVSSLADSLRKTLVGGRINKISQPEPDELILTIKNFDQYKLRISANASLPLVLLAEETKPAPITAPAFCMLLRKHLNSARIINVIQPDTERILMLQIEHLDELSDLKTKWLIIEIMGKHSNIIFCDSDWKILDSIKHVSALVSSVREVLPGRQYFVPKTTDKCSPIETKALLAASSVDEGLFGSSEWEQVFGKETCSSDIEAAWDAVRQKPMPLFKAIYTTFTGFSPLLAEELCSRAGVDGSRPGEALSAAEFSGLLDAFIDFRNATLSGSFTPRIFYEEAAPKEFHVFPISIYENSERFTTEILDSPSAMLSMYYLEKDKSSRMKQRSADLRKVVSSAIERTTKKADLQRKQLADTEGRDKFRIYGELLTTYGYSCPEGSTNFTCLNYYTNEDITIPLDSDLSAVENAKRYFDKYAKQKRTASQVKVHLAETEQELLHLRSVLESMEYADGEEDLAQIKKELTDFGYLKFHKTENNGKKKAKLPKSQPYHYVTADDYHIYVGKNNYQNDELTFHFAEGGDWWFHAKQAPGSHVILKSKGVEPPEHVFELAANLAAYYSSERTGTKVEIDYSEKKNIKKPNGAKPGFVVYYTNYSMIATPSVSELTLLDK